MRWNENLIRYSMLVIACCLWAGPAAAGGGDAQTLAPGSELRDNAKAATHQYRIELTAGQAARLSLRQGTGSLRLRDASATAATQLPRETAAGRGGLIQFTLIAEADRRWLIEVESAADRGEADYRLALDAAHPITEADRKAAAAEAALAQAEVWRRAGDRARYADEASAYANAVAGFRAVDDACALRTALLAQALSLKPQGDFPGVQKAAEAALAQPCSADIADRALAEYTLGSALHNQGNFADGVKHSEAALALFKQADDEFWQGRVLSNLTVIYGGVAQTAKAQDAARASLRFSTANNDARTTIFTRSALGYLHVVRGELAAALAVYQDVLRDLETTPYPLVEGTVWINLAFLYRQFGDAAQARAAYDRAQAVCSANDNRICLAQIDVNRGEDQLEDGDAEAAATSFRRALALSEKDHLERPRGQSLRGLGLYAMTGEHWAEARENLTTAVAILHKTTETDAEAQAVIALGDLESRQQHRAEAVRRYGEALRLARRAGDSILQSLALASRARVTADDGRLDAARRDIEASIALIETQRAQIHDPSLRSSYFASRRSYYELYVEILMRLHRRAPQAGHAAEALIAAERARARGLQDQLAERTITVEGALPAALLAEQSAAEDQLHRAAFELAQLPPKTPAVRRAALQAQVDNASRALDALRGRVRAANPRYAELANPKPLALDELRRQRLDGGTEVLEYWLGEQQSYRWRVTRDALEVAVLPPRAALETQVAALRDAALQPAQAASDASLEKLAALETASTSAVATQGQRLAALLLPPERSAGSSAVRTVIVADGELERLPFALLGAQGRSREWVYLPSLQTLRWLRPADSSREAAAKQPALAVFADPVFAADDPRLSSRPGIAEPSLPAHGIVRRAAEAAGLSKLPRLRHSREEAQALAALAPGTRVALDFAANRSAVMSADWSQVSLVHFATHALLDFRHPELSGVVLSLYDAQGRPQDGFLRINDLYNLRMPVDLVVLSACESALGKAAAGEGVFNLARAFFYAGTRRVLASLWTVDDRASAEFMRRFYEAHLGQKLDAGAALRRAQEGMAADPRYAAPYYWAGYVLQGDWQARQP